MSDSGWIKLPKGTAYGPGDVVRSGKRLAARASPDRRRNRPDSKLATDDWLTPPPLLEAAGEFDLGPCCPLKMPWRTAHRMLSNAGPRPVDGLKAEWRGSVWCNPPYSDILPWARRMAEHANGLFLVPAKSTDTRWGQLVLAEAKAVLFIGGRLLFHYPDGRPSSGKWAPSMLAAFGADAADRLKAVNQKYPGIIMRRSK